MNSKIFTCRSGLWPPRQKDSLYVVHESISHPGALWLVRHGCPNPADYIFFGYPTDTGSKGYGGRWITYEGRDGSVSIQGPWHSNADALFADVGVDVRSTYYVQFVAGLKWGDDVNGCRTIDGIVYYEEPHYGGFDDYKLILQRLYQQYRVPIYYWHGSSHGSVSGVYEGKQ